MFSILVFFVIIIDYITGRFYDFIAPDFGKRNLELALNQSSDKQKPLKMSPHPYLTYVATPEFRSGGYRQHNNMGYRNSDDTALEKSPSTIRILTLGGSTTYGTGVSNPQDSWPAQLEKLLNHSLSKISDYRVQVVNGGIPWATSAELLNHYIFRDRYLNPDIVILHTGGNDIGPLKHDNYNPEYTHWRTIRSGRGNFLRPGEERIIRSSNIIKLLYAFWYEKISYAKKGVYIHTKGSSKLTKEAITKNIMNNEPVGFERNLELLVRNIKQDGAIPLYFEFYSPGKEMFSDEGKAALEQANRKINFEEFFSIYRQAFKKNEKVAKKICSKENIEYIEIEPSGIPVEYLVDQCHLNSDGQAFKARHLQRYIIPYIEQLLDTDIPKTMTSLTSSSVVQPSHP